jgi:RHS repeat-associated protein
MASRLTSPTTDIWNLPYSSLKCLLLLVLLFFAVLDCTAQITPKVAGPCSNAVPGGGAAPNYAGRYISHTQDGAAAVVSTNVYWQQSARNLNLVVVWWKDISTQLPLVTDSAGNIYSLAIGPTINPNGFSVAVFYAKDIVGATAGTNTVTATFPVAVASPGLQVGEYSGLDKMNPLEVATGAAGSGTQANSGPLTTTNPNDLLVGISFGSTAYYQPGAGYLYRASLFGLTQGGVLEDRSVSSAGVYNATAPASGDWIMHLVAFRVANDVSPAFVQSNTAAAGTDQSSISAPFLTAQETGDFNLVAVGWRDASSQVVSVTDTIGNIYMLAAGPVVNPFGLSQSIYYAKNIRQTQPNQNQVLVTFSGAAHLPGLRIAEYKDIDQSDPIDAITGAYSNTYTYPSNSGVLSTTNAHDVLIAANLEEFDNQLDKSCDGTSAYYLRTATNIPSLEDRVVTSTGSYTSINALGTNWIMQLVALRVANQPPIVSAGSDQSITLPDSTVSLHGTATDDGLPSGTLTSNWSLVSGPGSVYFSNPAAPETDATFSASGTYVLQLTANDSQLAASSTVTVTVLQQVPAVASLTLSPSLAGPNVTGTSQSLTATLKNLDGSAILGTSVQFTVTGANPTTGNAITDGTGAAIFSYSGANSGSDTIQASAYPLTSNTATVNWIVPSQTVSTSSVFGSFFASTESGVFNTPATATPVFSQTFPAINFNPPSGTVTQQVSIDGRTVPWRVNGTINAAYYVSGISNTGLNPVSVPVTPGETISVAYVSGLWSISNPIGTVYGAGSGNGYGSWDANGMQPVVTGPGDALPAADAQSLVGGFADATGQIVSPGPFFIGNSFSATVPVLATQLLMGMNDGTTWGDNSGALVMNVTNGNAPNPAGVGVSTHPFTDVIADPGGNYTGTIVAQGEGVQAGGVGSLYAFQAVFRGTLTVSTPGDQSLYIFANDGFILGIGNGASRVSGPMVNAPSQTAFENLSVMGAYNSPEEQTNTIVVHFPAAGTYPYELDYADNGAGGQPINPPSNHSSLVMSVGVNISGQNVIKTLPPTASLALSPLIPPSRNTGESQTFSAKAMDAAGTPVSNLDITLVVIGANQQQLSATTDANGIAQFNYTANNAGVDVVEANATISGLGIISNSINVPWGIPAGAPPGSVVVLEQQGWMAQPMSGAIVTGQIPVTVVSGVTLASGTLKFWPSSNPSAVTILSSNTTGGGTLATFDATVLPSGGYTMQLVATDSTGATQTSVIVLSVVGQNKPGRMTKTVTEFTVPLAGIPITITRTYDSLERNTVGDFGYGWKLGTTVNLTVDAHQNVTFNFNGQRKTFYFRPQPSSFWFAWLLTPIYVPEPGTYGSLISDGCSGLMGVQGTWQCFSGGSYQPTVFAYTDPVGRTYTITAAGQLVSIKDLNGNTLTVTRDGITSSAGNTVIPFVRDGQGRITQISDLNQPPKLYTYSYDASGNLSSVQYPELTSPATYAYFSDHSLKTETDPRGNATDNTYRSDGRLETVKGPTVLDTNGNPVRYTTLYEYPATNTTRITNPDNGVITRVDDAYGKPLSITEQVDASTSRTTTYQYDAKENLVQMNDPLVHWTKYTYDANGFQTSVQLQGLPANSVTYNEFGGKTSETDAASTNAITTTYDSNFLPVQVTDLLNGAGTFVSTFAYDDMGSIKTYTDGNHKTTTFNYQYPQGYLQSKVDALNETTSYAYWPMGNVKTVTDPRGKVTQYFYDGLERLNRVIDANNVTKQIVYDNNGNKTDETEALYTSIQRNTHYDYDALNRLSKITYPDTTTKQFFYDFRGNKTKEIDQLGRVTMYAYDLAGQLRTVTYAFGTPDAGTISYAYYLDGRQQTVTDELSNVTTNFYDPAGRLTSIQDALHNSTSYGYDADNRRTSVIDANTHTTGYAYDARGRLKTITYPSAPATTTQYTYDGTGRVLTTTDQDGKVTTKAYDEVGRLSSVKDAILPTGNTTAYTYDLSGNLKTIQDALQRTTSFEHDNLNHRSKRTLPLLQFETYNYDELGRLHTKTDFNGKTTTYNYDARDRILSKVPDASLSQPTISFTYFATGPRKTMSDASGSTTYTYDNRDRMLSKATPEGNLSYTYDARGNVLTINSSNVNGASMTYTYDVLNRLATAKDNRVAAQGGPSTATTYSYDPAGNLTGYTSPNTLTTSNIFDNLNRLAQTCTATSSPACSAGTKRSSYTYTLGNAGNRANVLELGGRNATYGYDEDYRLKSEAITADPGGNIGTVNYVYDPVGNRASMSSTLAAVPGGQFFYDSNDRLTTDVYDNNGNTTRSAGITNTYNFENVMTGHGAVTILNDGDGNRVSETAGGVTTKYLVDDVNPTQLPQVVDEIVSGSVARTYAYGMQLISENQKIKNKWTPSYYGYDGHGNVRFLSSTTGVSTDTFQFDAFGMPIVTTGTTPNNFLYSGEWSDTSLGLYHLRARYYNQATGRFLSRDPEKGDCHSPATLHNYIYAGDDPVDNSDPSGRSYAETLQLDTRISVSPVVVRGLQLTAAAVICADLWVGSRTYAYSVAGSYGTVDMVAPCTFMARRRRGNSDPIPWPGQVNPGPNPDEPGKCKPCPPPSPYWDQPGNYHGGTTGVHFHWYTWNQKPYPDCTCYPNREAEGTPPPGGTPWQPGGNP